MTVYLSRIAISAFRCSAPRSLSANIFSDFVSPNTRVLFSKNDIFGILKTSVVRNYTSDAIQPTIPVENGTLPIKKKIVHKKASPAELSCREGHYLTLAYATANSYDLKSLKEALLQQKLYEPGR